MAKLAEEGVGVAKLAEEGAGVAKLTEEVPGVAKHAKERLGVVMGRVETVKSAVGACGTLAVGGCVVASLGKSVLCVGKPSAL